MTVVTPSRSVAEIQAAFETTVTQRYSRKKEYLDICSLSVC